MPGIIQSFDPGTVTCVVQPAIRYIGTDSKGQSITKSFPLLVDVPVTFPRGGGYTLTFPVGQAALYRQIAQMDQIYTDDVEGLYDRLGCPASVLWGRNDEWISCKKGDILANNIAGHKCIIIESAGHLVQED